MGLSYPVRRWLLGWNRRTDIWTWSEDILRGCAAQKRAQVYSFTCKILDKY